MATQQQLAAQMIAQLRVLDPSASAAVGTPERKIIDTVAQALAESQIDFSLLSGALDVDAKFGSDLDRFLSLLGFGRQQAVSATGFVTFSRTVASNYDIPIPSGTQVIAPGVPFSGHNNDGEIELAFITTNGATLVAGTTSVIAPIQANVAGVIGNISAGEITQFGASTILGITAINNDTPTQGGIDLESDDELKIRFKNTIFRNLSGTNDQYLALSVSTAFTTKANVVGPISRYREYIQVPDVDDATADPDSGVTGNNSAVGEYTSALSTIPYSKHIFDTVPYFLSVNAGTPTALFLRQDTDFRLNTSILARDRGDTYRGRMTGGLNVNTDSSTTYQPNVTFMNVLPSSDVDSEGIRPKDVILFEHSYMSTASRNDYERNLLNCVDVFINGVNPTLATSVIRRPTTGVNLFNANPQDPYYREYYRRDGEPEHRPVLGNLFTPLFWSPVVGLPDQIVVGGVTYFRGIHYWLARDISTDIGRTVRARDGIEWAKSIPGMALGDDVAGPYTGAKIAANSVTSVSVTDYSYDRNLVDLQAALEGSKQTTTDVLAHTAKTRYFKFDLTVMYSSGSSVTQVNDGIHNAVENYLDGLYFGTTLQLSDILQVVHNVGGVDNVRWSREILETQKTLGIISTIKDNKGNPRHRVVECDINGQPLANIILDRTATGASGTTEVWNMYFVGNPDTGNKYTLSFGHIDPDLGFIGSTTAPITYNGDGSYTGINSALSAVSIPASVTSGTGVVNDPFIITFSGTGARLPSVLTADVSLITGGEGAYDADFYLKDDELPALPQAAVTGDMANGLIIRPRAQNTWSQL